MVENNKSKPLLSANRLTCIREERILFDGLSFEITSGEIVQLEGPNGSGKTSLIRILAGLSIPYSGNVHYQEVNINKARDEFNNDIIYLGHLTGVKNELTAEENLSFNLKISGYEQFNTEDILGKVNLVGFEDATAGHLSAGQHRRTALARLWHTSCKIWLLDEPFTAIDKKGVQELEHLFVHHTKRGGCIVLTTHQDMQIISKNKLRKINLEYQLV